MSQDYERRRRQPQAGYARFEDKQLRRSFLGARRSPLALLTRRGMRTGGGECVACISPSASTLPTCNMFPPSPGIWQSLSERRDLSWWKLPEENPTPNIKYSSLFAYEGRSRKPSGKELSHGGSIKGKGAPDRIHRVTQSWIAFSRKARPRRNFPRVGNFRRS